MLNMGLCLIPTESLACIYAAPTSLCIAGYIQYNAKVCTGFGYAGNCFNYLCSFFCVVH